MRSSSFEQKKAEGLLLLSETLVKLDTNNLEGAILELDGVGFGGEKQVTFCAKMKEELSGSKERLVGIA